MLYVVIYEVLQIAIEVINNPTSLGLAIDFIITTPMCIYTLSKCVSFTFL